MKVRVKAIVTNLVGVVLILIAVGCSSATVADINFDKKIHSINIPAMNAAQALNELAFQTGAVLLFPYQEAKAQQANAVVGGYTLKQALMILLKDSGLVSSLTKDGAIRISVYGNQRLKKSEERMAMNTKKTLLAATIGFFMGGGVQGVVAQDDVGGQEENGWALEEIVVTAQKREQRLIDVPISIVAFGDEAIRDAGIKSINDLSYLAPSLSVVEASSGVQTITIRGISNGAGSAPLTGIYLDEVPLSVSPLLAVDLRAVDMERIEVLRGPQGTLYGQGSVGGTVRFASKRPSFEGFNGEIMSSFSDTKEGGESHELTIIANVPVIEEKLAFRTAITYQDIGGWIDQPESGSKDVNDKELSNMRIKGILNISSKLTVDTMFLRNRVDQGAQNIVNFGNATDSVYKVVDTGVIGEPSTTSTSDYDIYNLTLNYNLGVADLMSSSSYVDAKTDISSLSTFFELAEPISGITGFDRLQSGFVTDIEAFSQELRVVGATDTLDWVVGAFFTDVQENQMVTIGNYINGTTPFGPPVKFIDYKENKSNAVFADLSYQVNGCLFFGLGVRYFEDERTLKSSQNSFSLQKADFDNFSSKASLSYVLSNKMNMYLSISEGFRSGGLNAGQSNIYLPESVVSYEFGVKGIFYHDRISFDAAIFRSDYSEYQAEDFDFESGVASIGNPGDAEIDGFEAAIKMQVSEFFSFGVNGSFVDSEFTSTSITIPTVSVGDQLNNVPEYSYSINGDFSFNWASSIPGYAHIDINRQGPSTQTFRGHGLVREIDKSSAINSVNAKFGATWNSLSIEIFGRNLTNDIRSVNPDVVNRFVQNQPLTVGVGFRFEY